LTRRARRGRVARRVSQDPERRESRRAHAAYLEARRGNQNPRHACHGRKPWRAYEKRLAEHAVGGRGRESSQSRRRSSGRRRLGSRRMGRETPGQKTTSMPHLSSAGSSGCCRTGTWTRSFHGRGFFLTSFKKWREEILLQEATPTVFADLGYGVLDSAMVETAAYCLVKCS
jgi:hypothetical protein